MIVCTRCGSPNDDVSRVCMKCGHKLQSGRKHHHLAETGEPLPREMRPLKAPGLLSGAGKYLEAWVLVLVLGGAVGYALYSGSWVAVYVAGGATALTALARGL